MVHKNAVIARGIWMSGFAMFNRPVRIYGISQYAIAVHRQIGRATGPQVPTIRFSPLRVMDRIRLL